MKVFLATLFTLLLGLGILNLTGSRTSITGASVPVPPYVKAIYSMPLTFDPIKMNDETSLVFSELVYEGLLRFTEDYGVRPAIAKSWSTSPDGRIITFNIDPKAKFHNGYKVTAHDIKVSLTRNVSPESVVFKFYDVIVGAKDYFNGEANDVEGLKIVDPLTIEIHLEKPFPPILYVLAGATAKVLPAKLINTRDFFRKPIGSGPFKVSQINERTIHLVRFSEYHGRKPKLDEFILKKLNQDDAMKAASEGSVHDLSVWPMNGKEEVFQYGQNVSSVIADTWIIGLNTRLSPFDKLETRQLFQQSIDSEKFRVKFYEDSKPAYGYIAPSFPGHIEAAPNPELIVADPPGDFVTIHIPAELSKSQKMARFLEDELTSAGWNAEVVPLKWSEMMLGYNDKTLQAFLVAMKVDYPDAEFLLNNFESTNPDNFSGIEDDEIDSLISQSRRTQDRIERQKIQARLAKRVNDLALSVNLFHSRANYWIHSCVEGFKPNLLSVTYTDYRKVRFNMDCLSRESDSWQQLQASR